MEQSMKWLDTEGLSIDLLLCLERSQIVNLRRRFDYSDDWLVIFNKYPYIYKYFCVKDNGFYDICSNINRKKLTSELSYSTKEIEMRILLSLETEITYAAFPEKYEALNFSFNQEWLKGIISNYKKNALDIGAGTGKFSLFASKYVDYVYAIEPVETMRIYLKNKIYQESIKNISVVDGYLQDIPFPDKNFEVTIAGNIFGGSPENDLNEMLRVTKKGGCIAIIGTINNQNQNIHDFLATEGFSCLYGVDRRPHYCLIL